MQFYECIYLECLAVRKFLLFAEHPLLSNSLGGAEFESYIFAVSGRVD